MTIKLPEKAAALEAVLFASGDPIEPERLAGAAGVEKGALTQLADELDSYYARTGSALTVLKLSGSYQLATRPEFADNVKAAAESKKNAPLSPAAMEALTIIAYNQPVTKSFVEHIRGVDSSGVVNSLVTRDLVEEAGRLDVPGRPIAYRTTANFLRCFGLSSLEELPPLPGHVPENFDPLLVGDDGSSPDISNSQTELSDAPEVITGEQDEQAERPAEKGADSS